MAERQPQAASDEILAKLAHAIARELSRLRRRLSAIAKDVDREALAAELQTRAQLLVRSKLPKRGASEVSVVDYSCVPPKSVTIALDAALEPRAQIEGWFKTARRYQKGAELGRQRAATTRAEIDFLETVAQALAAPREAMDPDALAAWLSDTRVARLIGPGPQTKARPSIVVGKRRPFREFLALDGSPIWVGRGARDNDELTTKVARPQDLFLHVHDASGAHVIVPRNKGQEVPVELLLDAATLAHHFSAATKEARSDVTYVQRRYVQKRKGSPVGSVQLLRSKVLRLVLEPARLARLMASETKAQT